MSNEALNGLFELMSKGEVPDMLMVVAALSNIAELMTEDENGATLEAKHPCTAQGSRCPTCEG